MIHPHFEIQSESFLSADNKKLLREFNDKYDDWVYCGENDTSFNECQNKLIYIFLQKKETLGMLSLLIGNTTITPNRYKYNKIA